MTSEPVIVLYKSSACSHCLTLSGIWDTPPSKDEDSITGAIKKAYPKIRFHVLTVKDNSGRFDENLAPKDLIRYAVWFPMILLIPGKTWDLAMSKLGPNNDVKLLDGVQVMNGIWVDGELKAKSGPKYNTRKPSDFVQWIKDSLLNKDFDRIQNGEAPKQPMIVPMKPIRPLLGSIVKPITQENKIDDVCQMRIVTRPK